MKFDLESFGYKHGIPEKSVVLDMRCLENPFWVPELRELSGLDVPVQKYIFQNKGSLAYAEQVLQLLLMQAELGAKRGCDCISVAVGCTGGRHRSVAVAEYLTAALRRAGYEVTLRHRDLQREEPERSAQDVVFRECEK